VTDSRETDRILRLAQFSLDKSLDSVFWLDASAKIIIASDSACRNFGYEREELLSMSIDEIDPTYSEEGWVRYWEMLKREGSFRFESLHRTKAGRVYPVEILAYYLPHEGLEYNCVFARDISEQKMAEAALRDSEEQLRQAQKMEAIGQLAGGIAHDFNNLLTAVIGYSDLLLARKEIADSDAAEDVAEIKKAAERASALTRQILAFSRRQALQPAVVSLESILKGIEPLLRRTLGENVRLDIVAQSDAGNVEIDVHQFEQVIMNLALNARDAMASGGRLTIEASTVELDAEYCRAKLDVPPGPYAMLSVSDTGVGMSEEVLSRAFEPFFTTKAAGAGTGLGLSTVYGIIKQSGGGVAVESEVGKGTTFKVFLPLAEDSSLGVFGQARHAVTMVPAALPLGGETILVVEDEEALRNLTWRVLADVGYRVLLAASADEALPILRDHDGPLDAVLTDVVLPGSMQGNDLAAVVRAQHPGVPVIFMSGYTRDAIGHGGRLEEDVNFIQKPFTPEHVLARVREVLDASKRKPASRRPRPRRPTNQA
jgi:PAS domain S-box-containing protein